MSSWAPPLGRAQAPPAAALAGLQHAPLVPAASATFIGVQITPSQHVGATGQLLHSSQKGPKLWNPEAKCSFRLRTPGAEAHGQPPLGPGHTSGKQRVQTQSCPGGTATCQQPHVCQHSPLQDTQATARARTAPTATGLQRRETARGRLGLLQHREDQCAPATPSHLVTAEQDALVTTSPKPPSLSPWMFVDANACAKPSKDMVLGAAE